MRQLKNYPNTNLDYRQRLGYEEYIQAEDNWGPSSAQQHAKDETDINNIVARYGEKEIFTQAAQVQSVFADLTSVESYQEMLNKVCAADEAFMALPARLRTRFKNDAGELIDFLSDEKNYEEAVSLGLVERRQPKAQEKVTPPPPSQKAPADAPAQSS